jgi:hypothetical protein
MNSLLKSNKWRLAGSRGSVLPIVLIFAVFACIVASVYVGGQFTIARPSLGAPAALQALLNARSGVWKKIELMSKPAVDTLAKINTLDSLFNMRQKKPDTLTVSSLSFSIEDTPMTITPYSLDSFGTCEVLLSLSACFKTISSTGTFRNYSKTVRADIGGLLYSSPDTVLYLVKNALVEGGGNYDGRPSFISDAPDAVPPGIPPRDTLSKKKEFRDNELKQLVSAYNQKLTQKTDTILPTGPLTVQDNDKLGDIPDTLNGQLFIDGSHRPLVWKRSRPLCVSGDVQITGDVSVDKIEFIVGGEMKCLDKAHLHRVSVFCKKRLTIGDDAVFSGRAITLSSLLVYQRGRIEDKSVIVAYGTAPSDTGSVKKRIATIVLRQYASCDGVLVACGNPATVVTDKNTIVKGVVWAKGMVCHQGTLFGVLRAQELVDEKTIFPPSSGPPPPTSPNNVLKGSIRKLQAIDDYAFPFFMGRSCVVSWEEQ